MGSVMSEIECPCCKSEAHLDFYYKTGEEYIHCTHCGYRRSLEIIDRTKDIANPDNWKTEEHKPYAVYRIALYHSFGYQIGGLDTDDDYLKFKFEVDRDPEIRYASVNRFINGQIVTEVLTDTNFEVL